MSDLEPQDFYIKRNLVRPKWQVRVLRDQMQLLQLNKVRSLSPIEKDYTNFYGIDFGNLRSDVTHQLGYIRVDGLKIVVHSFEQKKPSSCGTILLVHGLFDHVGLYGSVISFFLAQGYSVVGFDLPGHGLSTGNPLETKSFSEYQVVFKRMVQLCEDLLPGPLSVFGQSTGGAIIIDFLTQRSQHTRSRFQHIILFAPLIRPVKWRQSVFLYTIFHPFIKRLPRRFLVNSSDKVFLQFLRQYDPLQASHLPLLWFGALKAWVKDVESRSVVAQSPIVLQGHKDGTVDWGHNITMVSRLFVTPKIVFVPHASHHLVNERSDILHDIYQCLAKCLEHPHTAEATHPIESA